MVVDGYCPAHRDGGRDVLRERASLGGQATRARFGGAAFEAGELKPINSLEDAKLSLDEIRIAVMTRRLTHAEGNAASKAISEWVKTQAATNTERLVNELTAELKEKTKEIADLRTQLSNRMRVA
jgi:hypothetical protein